MKTLIYDCRIKNPIVEQSDWREYEYLQISAIGAWVSWYSKPWRFQCFTEESFDRFQKLADKAEEIVGFNSIEFDDKLCAAQGIQIKTTYDLMREVRRAANQPTSGYCTPGYNLKNLAKVNLGKRTTPDIDAPWQYQTGQWGLLQEELLKDVQILQELYAMRDRIADPVFNRKLLHCDRRLTDWREIGSQLNNGLRKVCYAHTSRVLSDRNTNLLMLNIQMFRVASASFPIWIFPQLSPKKYIGLPFDGKLKAQKVDSIPF